MFMVSIFIFYFQQYISLIGINNIVFVDGRNYIGMIKDLLHKDLKLSDLLSSWLMYGIYIIPAYFLGTLGVIIFNHVILYFSYKNILFNKIHIITFCLFMPFFFIVSFLPNKENLVLFLSFIFVVLIYKELFFFAFLTALWSLFVRDGHGAYLLLFTIMIVIKFPYRIGILLIFLGGTIVDFYLKEIIDMLDLFILNRIMYVIESTEATIVSYPLRIFANISNLASRVFIFDGTSLSLTGIGLYLAGLGIFMATILAVYNLFLNYNKNDIFENRLAVMFLLSILIFSVSPLIQPRYLIPLALIYLVTSPSINEYKNKKLFYLLIISFIFSTVLRITYTFSIGLPDGGKFNLEYENIFYEGVLLD